MMDKGQALRRFTASSGTGFCYKYIPRLFSTRQGHGPLLIAWDSNILIDLQDHGAQLIEDAPTGVADPKYAVELDALGTLLNVWMLRDIRFVLSPRSLTDAKAKADGPRVMRKRRSITRLAESLAFQIEDWGEEYLRFVKLTRTEHEPLLTEVEVPGIADAFPEGADRDLIIEAIQCGLDVFLSRDDRVINARDSIDGVALKILRPTELVEIFNAEGITVLSGGIYPHDDCPYDQPLPAGDMGKWSGLLSVLSP